MIFLYLLIKYLNYWKLFHNSETKEMSKKILGFGDRFRPNICSIKRNQSQKPHNLVLIVAV